jgi:hypothetical protein
MISGREARSRARKHDGDTHSVICRRVDRRPHTLRRAPPRHRARYSRSSSPPTRPLPRFSAHRCGAGPHPVHPTSLARRAWPNPEATLLHCPQTVREWAADGDAASQRARCREPHSAADALGGGFSKRQRPSEKPTPFSAAASKHRGGNVRQTRSTTVVLTYQSH